MLGVIGNSWALFLGIALLMLGNGLQGSLLGVRGSLEAFSPELMGYVMSAYFLGLIAGSWATPHMLRRVGHIRVFAALASLISAAFILYAAVVDPIMWFLMRVLVGFCFSGVYVVAESWINDASTNETRGKALSAYMIVQMGGIVAGQLLLNLADPRGYELFVLISVLVSVSFAPILLSVSPAPVYQSAKPMSLMELFRTSPLGAVGSFFLGGVFGALFGMGSVYGTEIGLTVFEVSILLAAIYAGGTLFQYPIGWLSDRIDRRFLIVWTALAALASCIVSILLWPIILVTVGEFPVRVLYVTAVLVGGFGNPLYGLFAAHTNDFLEREQMASASSGLVMLNGVGAMLGPVVTGFLMEPSRLGPIGWWFFLAAMFTGIAAYGAYRATQRPTVSVEETGPFAAYAPRVTPVAAEMIQEAAYDKWEEEIAAENEEAGAEASDGNEPAAEKASA